MKQVIVIFNFSKVKTIFFDYDGTLHNSIKIYAPAFQKAYAYLVQNGYAEEKPLSEKEISYWLGYNSQEMWKEFMPNLPQEMKDYCSQIIGTEMKRLVEQGRAVLYEGALETLKYLKDKGYKLIFISNCKIYYRDAHNNAFQLSKYFDDIVCSEEYGFVPKHEILGNIIHRYQQEMVIIGDRKQDIEAGNINSIYTIGCSYGFAAEGELDTADIIIDRIEEIRNYF
jgi:phosphoglycolate phosphatase